MKLVLRAAKQLHRIWLTNAAETGRHGHALLACLADRHEAVQQARQRLAKAQARSLSLVLPSLKEDLLGCVRLVRDAANEARQSLAEPAPAVPSVATLAAELQQVDAEFTGLRIKWREKVLSVTTEPITLEGVDLGAFEIQLCWKRLAHFSGSHCFDIVAVDPNRSAADDLVTHPHVKDQELCAGKATTALQKALKDGRLADAFHLIRSVLSHYNARSAHVPLDG
jgi:hypothetical protein